MKIRGVLWRIMQLQQVENVLKNKWLVSFGFKGGI
jgi:hypothetical protein